EELGRIRYRGRDDPQYWIRRPAAEGSPRMLIVAGVHGDERAALLHLAAAGVRAAAGRPFLETGSAVAPHVRVTSGLVAPEDADEVAAALAGAAAH
ncbi:MAG: hypothetical protein CMJ44_07140, partial [Pimelobacter sp.]|nr:hypothetical protein [Pimelobacter sp.]